MNDGIFTNRALEYPPDVYGIKPLFENISVIRTPFHYPANTNWNQNHNNIILVHDLSKTFRRSNYGTINIPTKTIYFKVIGNANIVVDWGDGYTDSLTSSSIFTLLSHTYSDYGIYTVIVYGNFNVFGPYSANYPDYRSLVEVKSFGNNTTNITYAFMEAINLIKVPNTLPIAVTHLNNLFWRAENFNNFNVSFWDTSNITSMASVFLNATSFNQSLDSWNVSKVTNFTSMFQSATSFNGSLSGWQLVANNVNCQSMFQSATSFEGRGLDSWDTSGVVSMQRMFRDAISFNANIGSWNTSKVNNMFETFLGASNFNQPIGDWDTSNVTTMYAMFRGSSFNQPLNNWNVSKVTDMRDMFMLTPFNQNLNNWDVSNVTLMGRLFNSCPSFNGDISSWNTSKVTSMNEMFGGCANFNQNISSWNTSSVSNMFAMFISASSFNQPIGGWDVSKVSTMSSMFNSALSFNNDLSNWNLAGLNSNTSLDNFMLGKNAANAYSTANYDALLIGWNNNKASDVNGVADWRTDLRPHFGQAKYTAGGDAAAARASLVSYGWTITDGGSV